MDSGQKLRPKMKFYRSPGPQWVHTPETIVTEIPQPKRSRLNRLNRGNLRQQARLQF